MSEEFKFEGIDDQEPKTKDPDSTSAEAPSTDSADATPAPSSDSATTQEETNSGELPAYAKQRLGQQKKHYEKRIKQLEQQFREKEQSLQAPHQGDPAYQAQNGWQQAQQSPIGDGEDPNSVRAQVLQALNEQKEMSAREAQEAKLFDEQNYRAKQVSEFEDKLAEASTRYDDYDEVVRNDKLPLTEAMVQAAMILPNGPDLLYHLGKNTAEVQKLAHLHPYKQAQEIARLGMNLGQRQTVSKAPAPTGSHGKGTQTGSSSMSNMSYSQLKDKLKKRR